MRANKTIVLLVAIGTLEACKWTEFDDLAEQTGVASTEPPNGDSTDYAVAIQRGKKDTTAGEGGKLVVIGAGQAQYTELVYSSTGSVSLAPTALKLNSQFGVGNLEAQPLLIADPASDEISLIANTGGSQLAVLHGVAGLLDRQIFGPETPDAATYMLPPPRQDALTTTQQSQPIVAAGDSVYGAMYQNYPTPSPRCQLLDAQGTGMPVTIRAIGAFKATPTSTTHDLVVWGTVGTSQEGRLFLYPGGVFNGHPGAMFNQMSVGDATICPGTGMSGTAGPLANSMNVITPNFVPGRGSQILIYQERYAILIGRKDLPNPDSFIAMYDLQAMSGGMMMPALKGTPNTVPDLRTGAILEAGTMTYLVAGYPTATFDGVKAGRVQVYEFNTTTGVSGSTAMTLHDASPEGEQAFGRGVAVTEFNGEPVIAVAADNEVFFYFRTALYEETREGR